MLGYPKQLRFLLAEILGSVETTWTVSQNQGFFPEPFGLACCKFQAGFWACMDQPTAGWSTKPRKRVNLMTRTLCYRRARYGASYDDLILLSEERPQDASTPPSSP
jgi:hypothetical protein